MLFLLFLFGSLRVKNEDQALILGGGNAALSFIVLLVLLSKHAPTWDGLATLVLALFNLTLSFVREDSTRGWGYRLAGLALLIIFVPLQFDRAWITLAWAVLGAALYWTGVQKDWLPIRIAGYTALGLATLKALLWDVSVLHFPDRTIGLLAATVALIATGVVPITALRAKVKHIETAHTLLIVAGTILITITFATEILDGNGLLRMASENARQIILSIIWAAEAVLLLFMGMRDSESALRTTGLILFAITVLKVLFIDVSDIATVYRIIVTLVVGLIALGGAYYYVRNNAKN